MRFLVLHCRFGVRTGDVGLKLDELMGSIRLSFPDGGSAWFPMRALQPV